MKEDTKKKIIKTAKIAGMVMTAFFAVLGLVFSAAALNKCSGGEDNRVSLVTLDNSSPKQLRNDLDVYSLDNYQEDSWQDIQIVSHLENLLTFQRLANGVEIRKYALPAGEYILLNPNGEATALGFALLEYSESANVDRVLDIVEVSTDGGIYSAVDLESLQFYNWQSSFRFSLTEKCAFYLRGFARFLNLYRIHDLNNDPVIMSVNWGFQWFPWQMMGYAGSNPVILSDIAGSIEDVHVIEHRYLDGFYFRSNGKLYKKIDFMYSWASGSELTDGSGKFFTVSNANAWYIQEVRYYYGDGADEYDVVARFSVFESPSNHYNIPAYGPLAWVAPAFRQIDIVYIADENAVITTNTGSYTLSQWIEILLQPMSGDININVIQGGDPFSLMTTAFDSMKGILSIAVLPGISLGLLLFLPIIAGIIVIILRVVKR